jgi:disulfide bond formation protein DsbB
MGRTLAANLNALGIYAVALVLAAAFAAQLVLDELPCPLCLLQRIQFAMLAVGPILNVRFGPRPSHYALALLAAAVGAVFSMRQILLHVMPGDPGFGSALLGYHYYTWAFLGFAIAIVLIAAMLLFDHQFAPDVDAPAQQAGAFGQIAVWLVIALTALNVVATLLECGLCSLPGQSGRVRAAQIEYMKSYPPHRPRQSSPEWRIFPEP